MSEHGEQHDIDQTAADWVVRLDARTPTLREQQTLNDWLGEDARHYGAYARARAVFLSFDRLRSPAGDQAGHALPVLAAAPRLLRRRAMLLLTGGSLAAAIAGVGVFVTRSESSYSTSTGELRRVALADGSAITLNTRTQLTVVFTKLAREVRLLGGEVLFEVAADALRPFTVNTFATRVTTLAAAFTVRALRADDVQVMVREGQVRVSEPGNHAAVMLAANTLTRPVSLRDEPSGPAPLTAVRLDPVEVDRRLAWQRGQLSFEDVSLRDALQEFARYSDTPVVIDDPAISQLKVVGLYSASDPVGFAKTVAISLGLRVELRDGVVHLKTS